MKRLAIAMAIGAVMACGGGSSPSAPTPAPANIAGSYNASITASTACSATLPAAAWVLSYAAEVTQSGAAIQVKLNPHGGSSVTVTGTVSGQTVSFPSFSLNGTTAGVPLSVVTAGTTANVAADGSITGPLSGTYQAGTSCTAADHQLQMRRCVVTCSGNICSCG